MNHKYAIAIINPISSANEYNLKISESGYLPIAIYTGAIEHQQYKRFVDTSSFDMAIFADDINDVIEKLSSFNILAVIPGSDCGIEYADKLARHFKTCGNNPGSWLKRFDKFSAIAALREVGLYKGYSLEIPKHLPPQDSSLTSEIVYPCVIKRSQGTGALGVKICHSYDELVKAVDENLEFTESSDEVVFVEKYALGMEFSATLINEGAEAPRRLLCLMAYEKYPDKIFPGIYKTISSISVKSDFALECLNFCSQVNAALEFNYGINDIEFKYDSGEFYFIEQNGRLPGANTPNLISASTNVDCYIENIKIYSGLKSFDEIIQTSFFSVVFIPNYKTAEIKAVRGLNEIKRLPSYYSHKTYLEPGKIAESTSNFMNTALQISLLSENPLKLQDDIKIVCTLIHIEYANS
ncbi:MULTISPECIES: ATP-grasp domain-containing protein [Pseudomonas]|uniref:ATP-grasp domain-containing protein n=1 Tax=Pseudomonas quercus TaxID=2722792 RepID=A0ABX0YIS3_9PSED|nr:MULTISPECIES: ATP-grasp domain-containing protein [Pseudomonas]MBF7143063.1 ATP-grasp domain-containing protein [Pseudomonas sp. LY10J]NJP01908.1 ATP-grasp domain-containing protein [Pseudomonas quercus]